MTENGYPNDTGGLDAVTGAFGFTGSAIARRLLAGGRRVRTLTGHPDRSDPFGGRIEVAPLRFRDPDGLARSLEGADVLYNTYWVRFPRGKTNFEGAVENSRILFRAAERAGVRRIVHVSITNPSEGSPLPYFRGKALVERSLLEARPSSAILRPTVIFGERDILINNIAWCLRRFPAFPVFRSGRYRLQPIHVEDMAEIAVEAGRGEEKITLDAAGPEVFTYEDLVELIAGKIGRRVKILHVPSWLGRLLAGLVGLWVGDVLITRDEIAGLMEDLLVSREPPRGKIGLGTWLEENAGSVGQRYASEIERHYRHIEMP